MCGMGNKEEESEMTARLFPWAPEFMVIAFSVRWRTQAKKQFYWYT